MSVRDSIRRAAARADTVTIGDQVLPRAVAEKLCVRLRAIELESLERQQAIRERYGRKMYGPSVFDELNSILQRLHR